MRFGQTVNPLSRLGKWRSERDLPPCPAGAIIWVETIEVRSTELATASALETAFLEGSDSVIVHYRQESGNAYCCYFSEFSLGEAGIILQAMADMEPGASDTDRHVSLMNRWAAELRERVEKEAANRVT